MTSIVNSRPACIVAAATLLASGIVMPASADEPVLRLSATVAASTPIPLTIELLRWSTDAERAALVKAMSPPPPPPEPAPAAGRRGGRGGRGGRGAAPLTPAASLSAAVKETPTVGFIWGDGPTGYAIRYAWRDTTSGAPARIVLMTDRHLGENSPSWPQAPEPPADVEFTVLEIRFEAKGVGKGRASLVLPVVDATTQTLALPAEAPAPVLFEVTR